MMEPPSVQGTQAEATLGSPARNITRRHIAFESVWFVRDSLLPRNTVERLVDGVDQLCEIGGKRAKRPGRGERCEVAGHVDATRRKAQSLVHAY